MKKITIIIPHFNEWKNLDELLKTIPVKSIVEVIVIDDWSDNYKENIQKFKIEFPHITFLSNDEGKKGAGAARNVGLRHANGEWLLFADSDDKFTSNFNEIISRYLDSNKDLIYFMPTSFNEDDNISSTRHKLYEKYIVNYLTKNTKYHENRLRYFYVVPWSKLIRRNVVATNKIFFEETMFSNDILFSAKVGYYSGRIDASMDNIYSVRESDDSLTSVIDQERLTIRFEAWLDYVNFIKSKLSRKDFLDINLTATPFIQKIIKYKLGIKLLIKVIKESKKNSIPVIDKRLFNVQFMRKYFKKETN